MHIDHFNHTVDLSWAFVFRLWSHRSLLDLEDYEGGMHIMTGLTTFATPCDARTSISHEIEIQGFGTSRVSCLGE